MTPELSTEDFAALGAPDLVYVRPVKGAEIHAGVMGSDHCPVSVDIDV